MIEYYVPAMEGETELTEKRSRFIGHAKRVENEADARAYIAAIKTKYHDARHHCWCYILREGTILRYSDDGEPQGTAGQPILEVFRREKIENVCCVVTRYFGGILLGAGGLVRAYAASAKQTLDAAGIAVMRREMEVSISCPYHLFDRMKLELAYGTITRIEYTNIVILYALIPVDRLSDLSASVTELSGGTVVVEVLGEQFSAHPLK
ncbi:MAG: YigZ family protein [Evtepia sp.]